MPVPGASGGSSAPGEVAPTLPSAWINAREAQTRLWASLASGAPSLLICDYDGTLAPFKADKMLATPYPGIAERLRAIVNLPGATLALVSGRPVAELITLFPLASHIDLYGSHGREHRSAAGAYSLAEPDQSVRASLSAAAAALEQAGYGGALERKAASLAVHWRNLSPAEQAALARAAGNIFALHTGDGALSVLPFESGMELRATDHTKAHAVEALLAAQPGSAVAAYLGDDTTDEDAFRALGSRGLSLLVREEPRASLANYWLRPPAQLVGFLDDWLRAASRGSLAR